MSLPDGYRLMFYCWVLDEFTEAPCACHPRCPSREGKRLLLEVIR